MLRSLSSAISGLRAQQTAMDVIGNNIANVNTAGFKSGFANFSDLFYETMSEGTAGTTPSQVGYGAHVASVSKNMSSTGANETDASYDLYLDGEGYFAVNTQADGKGKTYYTRVGNFNFDAKGYLRDQTTGDYVLSNMKDKDGNYQPVQENSGTQNMYIKDVNGKLTQITDANIGSLLNVKIAKDGSLTGSLGTTQGTLVFGTEDANQPEQVQVNTFMNQEGLESMGDNLYKATESSGAANVMTADPNNNCNIEAGYLEASNVDLAKEMTNMIVTERGFQANSRIITVSDSMLEELVNLKRS